MNTRFLNLGKEELFDALEYVCNTQNTDYLSESTNNQLDNITQQLVELRSKDDTNLANALWDALFVSNRHCFKKGFVDAMAYMNRPKELEQLCNKCKEILPKEMLEQIHNTYNQQNTFECNESNLESALHELFTNGNIDGYIQGFMAANSLLGTLYSFSLNND